MIVKVNHFELELRDGTSADMPLLLSMIHSLAEFEKLPVTATEESLRAALFGDPPAAHSILAFDEGKPVGYATYFFTFASFSNKRGLWLDDLFVVPEFRGTGVGHAIMAHVAEIAVRHNCGKMEWMVLDWNENAIGFYQRLGATVLTDWRICRLNQERLPMMIGTGKTPRMDTKSNFPTEPEA